MNPELNKRPTRRGKIARLPHSVREELNQRLRDGEEAKPLLRWLNREDEVYTRINAQNLTEWRQGGYAEWLTRQEQCEMVWRFAEEAQSLEAASPGMRISQCLSIQAGAQLILRFQTLLAQPAESKERFEELDRLIRSLALLRREDTKALQAQFQADKFHWQQVKADRDEYSPAKDMPGLMSYITAKSALMNQQQPDEEFEDEEEEEEDDEGLDAEGDVSEEPPKPKAARPPGPRKQEPKAAACQPPALPANAPTAPAASPTETAPKPEPAKGANQTADQAESNLIKVNQASEPTGSNQAPTPAEPDQNKPATATGKPRSDLPAHPTPKSQPIAPALPASSPGAAAPQANEPKSNLIKLNQGSALTSAPPDGGNPGAESLLA